MSIRTRLTLAILALLLVTIGALGLEFVRATRATLVDQVDARVLQIAVRNTDDRPRGDAGGTGAEGDASEDRGKSASASPEATPLIAPAGTIPATVAAGSTVAYRDVCRITYDQHGNVEREERCGYSDEPLSPPRFDGRGDHAVAVADADSLVTLPSQDGTLAYRAAITADAGGGVTDTASPLDGVDATVDRLVGRLLIVGALALVAAGALSWWSIRRGLRPVEGMVETATAIAAGDLSRRVEVDQPGTELGRLGVALNDMLAQIEAALDARAASEARMREFVGDAAHELRTPLTSLRGWAELYRRGMIGGDDGVKTAMARIESEGERMALLVDDLLLLARMDQQRPMEFAPLDLAALARDAALDFAAADPDRPLTLHADTAAPVVGDRHRLRQVVDNLLRNVRIHTPADAAVTVSVATVAGMVELRVADTGPGIPPEEQSRVFERFWRGDASRSRAKGGSGLGLAIVAAIVDAHGGTVAVESAPGAGATFILRIPAAPTGDAAASHG